MVPNTVHRQNACQTQPLTRPIQRRQLGRHAFETRMPKRITTLLETQDQTTANRLPNIIPVLHDLLLSDPEVASAYLCDASVAQIHRLEGEGQHFCAYRNMQMLLSCLPGPSVEGISVSGRGRAPDVLELQRLIERAWDCGFNAHGRVETGGIVGTRKHVGTAEVGLPYPFLKTHFSYMLYSSDTYLPFRYVMQQESLPDTEDLTRLKPCSSI